VPERNHTSVIVQPRRVLLCGTLIDLVEVLGAVIRLKDAILSP
jgi:hypothetical protein